MLIREVTGSGWYRCVLIREVTGSGWYRCVLIREVTGSGGYRCRDQVSHRGGFPPVEGPGVCRMTAPWRSVIGAVFLFCFFYGPTGTCIGVGGGVIRNPGNPPSDPALEGSHRCVRYIREVTGSGGYRCVLMTVTHGQSNT